MENNEVFRKPDLQGSLQKEIVFIYLFRSFRIEYKPLVEDKMGGKIFKFLRKRINLESYGWNESPLIKRRLFAGPFEQSLPHGVDTTFVTLQTAHNSVTCIRNRTGVCMQLFCIPLKISRDRSTLARCSDSKELYYRTKSVKRISRVANPDCALYRVFFKSSAREQASIKYFQSLFIFRSFHPSDSQL